MKISIITVVYNNERTIRDALESVLLQSYKNIEYVVIDGNSNDGTVKIINEYYDQLGYFVSESDHGLYDAMNKGIQASTGDVIGILNSDDLYQDLDVIASVMEEFNNDSQLDILYGNLVYVKTVDVGKVVRNWKSKSYYNNFFEEANVPPHPSLFVRKKVYDQVGLFDLDYKIAADYEFMLRIFKKYNFKSKYIDRLIVRMRLGGASNAGLVSVIKQNIEVVNAWKKNKLKRSFYLIPLRFLKKITQYFMF
jgi:glycosyltransferase involved in cell wall biosynthesis